MASRKCAACLSLRAHRPIVPDSPAATLRSNLDMLTFLSLAVAAVPGVFAWWTGRQLVARRDDPALPERIVARANRLVQVMAASGGVLLVVSPHKPWILVLPVLGL